MALGAVRLSPCVSFVPSEPMAAIGQVLSCSAREELTLKVRRAHGVALTLSFGLLLSAGICVVPSAMAPAAGLSSIVPPAPPERLLTEAEAVAQAQETGEPTVVDTLTTPTQIVRAVPETGLVAEISPGPVRVHQSDGWHEVDASLEPDGAGRLAPVTAPAEFTITADGTGPLAELAGPSGEQIALSWPAEYGDLPVPRVDGNLATFAGVWGGQVDLVVGASVAGFQTYLVLHDRAAAELPQVADFHFDITASGVDIADDGEGGLEATNGTGEVVFASSDPEQWDAGDVAEASGSAAKSSAAEPDLASAETDPPTAEEIRRLVERPDGARSAAMTMTLESESTATEGEAQSGQTAAELHVRSDKSMLLAEETQFPAVLDPNLTRADLGAEWGMYWSTGEHWYGDVALGRAGYDGWSSGPKKARSFYKFDIESLQGTEIQEATFLHMQFHSPEHTCNTTGAGIEVWTVEAFDSGTRWPGPAKVGYQSTNYKARGHEDYCSTNYENEWDVKKGLASDLSNGYDRMRLGMFAKDETNEYSWRKYGASDGAYPKLLVTYNRAPNVPTGRFTGNTSTDDAVLYNSKYYVRVRQPVLLATTTDPDGNQVQQRFVVRNSSGEIVVDRRNAFHPSDPPTQSGITLTENLPDGTYSWWVYGIDSYGFQGPASSWLTMVIDNVKPDPPVIEAPKVGSYGQGVTISMDSPSSDVLHYNYGFLTSATPISKRLDPLSEKLTVTRTGHMGPDWITATASDIAGNPSVPKQLRFKVMGASTSHQWHLDGNGNDEAPSEQQPTTLALSGSPTWVGGHDRDYDPVGSGSQTWAVGDKALALNGTSQYAKSSGENANAVNPDKGFALSAWVKLDPAAVDTGAFTVASLSLPDTSAKKVALEYRSQGWQFAVRTGSGSTNKWESVNGPTGSIGRYAGKWVHLVGVYEKDPSQLRLYIDGIEAATPFAVQAAADESPTIDQPSTETLMPVWVGAGAASTPDAYFKGVIDEVRAYSGPLDPTGAFLVSREVRNTP
ncbi:LamG-like jellyroll fold domain-containing protein [Nocardioides sp. YR527]|uniref:LamG-like jellyroll fold domain-containing protein n=1 Tax=Nocardioides sp. YR527 TaxID=1881028 RepID=UPI0015A1FEF8|nr:LamG-like jellyroll fold domain-containing protein [Nocardioides sp. YR527]